LRRAASVADDRCSTAAMSGENPSASHVASVREAASAVTALETLETLEVFETLEIAGVKGSSGFEASLDDGIGARFTSSWAGASSETRWAGAGAAVAEAGFPNLLGAHSAASGFSADGSLRGRSACGKALTSGVSIDGRFGTAGGRRARAVARSGACVRAGAPGFPTAAGFPKAARSSRRAAVWPRSAAM
jgi:hypothetical protein